ncbi:hypothetical protein TW95_gp0126 [Pandoravirus inopinatum]|uniref:Uncharacterized protein n=1 Tax=Pandoravirus inopinatum TaxID=1605721 RepID=A0A0B5J5D6_9VIRU|nr:hypothetical protein TW95_gp0126 [Pandoravirus inopinatum]AJF96860.1 hypothetical protein [Pandoravirus inopinatum]
MGQANTTIKGYSAVSQDALFATYGVTEGDYQAKASAAIDRIRAMPDGYASPEDRAAAINAIRTGTCGYVVVVSTPCVCRRRFFFLLVSDVCCLRIRLTCLCLCSDDTELLTRVRAALDRWQRDCAATGRALKSKVV